MASTYEKLEKSMAKITCTVSPEEFKEGLQKAFKKLHGRFQIPGFRKGKAPYKVVVNYYGEGVLYDDALDFLLDPAYKAALDEHQVKPFSRPSVDIQEIGSDKGLTFSCEFALRPELELKQYKGIEAYRPAVSVDEQKIDQEIDRVRMRNSRLLPVERPVEDGDICTIDYKGLKDGVPFDGGSAQGHELVIGSHSFIPGFEEQLIGHEKGESFTIDLSFPEDYHAKELAGQPVQFEIVLHDIRKRELPEVDDEFVKDVDADCETVAEYREKIRKEQEGFAKDRADQTFHENVMQKALELNPVEMPEAAVQDEMDRLMDQQRQQMARQGFRLEDYLRYLNMDEKLFRLQLHEPALRNLQAEILLDAVAKAEGLTVSDEDIKHELEHMAEHVRASVEDLEKIYLPEGEAREMLTEGILADKARQFLYDNAVATDKAPEAPAAEAEEAPKAKKTRAKSTKKAEKADEANADEPKAEKKTTRKRTTKKTEEAEA